MDKQSKILIIGHSDIVENSLTEHLIRKDYKDVISSSEMKLDLFHQGKVEKFFEDNKPEYVFLGSSRSGGIEANQKYAAEFMYSNLTIQNHVIHSAYRFGVKKLLFFSSSCVYPKDCPQPIREEYLLTGPLEPTSEPYAVAKIAGIRMCQAYKRQHGLNAIVMIPATIYGPGSDFDPRTAHVLGALVGKFRQAVKEGRHSAELWGSGRARREFIYVDDFVSAAMFLMENYDGEGIVNAGSGTDMTIRELAEYISRMSGFRGSIAFNASMPDGAMQKLLDSERINSLGWKASIPLEEGIARTVEWYDEQMSGN